MKNIMKTMALALLLTLSAVPVCAKSLTQAQRTFLNNISSFLREEGFAPSIDGDNSLAFKKEGVSYWIDIDESNPFYLEFHHSGLNCTDADMGAVLQACNKTNLNKKCAKVALGPNGVAITVELFCHSAEEFKYVFYRSIKALDVAYGAVKDAYAGYSQDVDTAAYDDSAAGSSLIELFFPVEGCTPGVSTTRDLRRKGYKVEGKHCDVEGLTYWDHNEDGVFEDIYLTHSDPMPSKWREMGVNWRVSYNKLLAMFKNWGFVIDVTKTPTTKTYSGRKTLSAEFTAASPDGRLAFDFDFDYGNDKGEGYSQSSSNSLYSITIRTK